RFLGEACDRALDAFGGLSMQPGAVERAVEITADEVAHAGVAKVDRDAGNRRQPTKLGVGGNLFAAHVASGARGNAGTTPPNPQVQSRRAAPLRRSAAELLVSGRGACRSCARRSRARA